MRHGSNKFKVQGGIDANKMLLRKLTFNFLRSGKITTTAKKAKVLKQYLERIVEKSKKDTESNRNFLLKLMVKPALVRSLFKHVGPVMSDRVGGYVKTQKMYQRDSDGSLMVKVEWSVPVVMEEVKKPLATKTEDKKVEVQK